jgi:23S rRNA (cytosine1962-C5)-methyltransferase
MAASRGTGPRGGGRRRGGPIVRRGTIRLAPDIARRLRCGHPWVYREAVDRRRVEHERPGNTLELVDSAGEFVARGVYDGDTAIAVRVFSRRPKEDIDAAFVRRQVSSAIALRRRHIDLERFQCIRLINAESDSLPAMVVEQYGRYLVAQVFSPATLRYRDLVYDALAAELEPAAIYEQRRFKSLGGESPGGAELVRGNPAPVELQVREGDLKFLVDVSAPLSTGLFADLRLGREAIRRWADGRRVLNLFSYTGSISVCAAAGGAREVVAVDLAAKAHARARRNFAINGFDPEKPEHLAGDTFGLLEKFKQRNRRFDLVVIDPPAFASAPRGGKPWVAAKDYSELVAACLAVTEPGGLVVAASSTRKLSPAEFDLALAEGAARAGTRLRIIEQVSLPPDFPITAGFPEGNYLKFAIAVRD